MRQDSPERVQPLELVQYFYSHAHDPIIRCRIDLDGHIDERLLRRAVAISVHAMPLLECVFDPTTCSWEPRGLDSDVGVTVSYISDQQYTSNQCTGSHRPSNQNAVEDEFLGTLPSNAAPRIRIHVMRRPAKDALCILADHMVCDGAGFKDHLYLLAKIYSALVCGEDAWAPTRGYPLRRDLGQATDDLGAAGRIQILASRTTTPKPSPLMRMPLDGEGDEGHMAVSRIEADAFARIHSRVKALGASLNDAFLAAYACMIQQVTGCSDIMIPCPVDLRVHAPASQRFGICNLTSNYFCHVNVADGERLSELLSRVAAQMRAQKESDACLKGPILLDSLSRRLGLKGLEKLFFKVADVPEISYSNLGVIDDERLVFGNLGVTDAFIATALKRAPSFQMSLSTFRGVCTMTSCLYADVHDAQLADSLLEAVRGELVYLTDIPEEKRTI